MYPAASPYATKLKDHLNQSKKKEPGFLDQFVKRTIFRVKEAMKYPLASVVYYAASAAPIPLWSEQDAASLVKAMVDKRFEAPHLPSAEQENLMRIVAVRGAKDDARILFSRAPTMKYAYVQQSQNSRGEIPTQVHLLLPRPQEHPAFNPKARDLQHFQFAATRVSQGKPVYLARRRMA